MVLFKPKNLIQSGLWGVIVLTLPDCMPLSPASSTSPGESWQQSNRVVVLTRHAPSIFHYDQQGSPLGFEYELASLFIKQKLGKIPEFRQLETTEKILAALERQEGDFAAAAITASESRKKLFAFGPSYKSVEQYVVCSPELRVRRPADLIGKVLIVTGSSHYVELLNKLRVEVPGVEYHTTSQLDTEELLEQVAEKSVQCTVSDSSIFRLARLHLPRLNPSFSLGESGFFAWPTSHENKGLLQQMDEWFVQFSQTKKFHELKEKYFGFTDHFDYYDIMVFRKRIKSRLPHYLGYINEASERSNFEPELLAAIAYQESHWNPRSKSPTGVRGFMMLTQTTAKEMGVKNRLDPKQSMIAGSLYLRKLYQRLPEHIPPIDRLFLTLAAYNMGYHHLKDAQHLAIDLGKNPNSWLAIKSILPLLSQKKHYKRLKYGYARGFEALSYVTRIRAYRSILLKQWPKAPQA